MTKNRGISPEKLAFKRLFKNRIAQFSFGVILLIVLVAILGPFVRPDHSPDANTQLLSISRQKPGYTANLLVIHKNEPYTRPNIWKCISAGGWDNCSTYIPIEKWEVRNDSLVYLATGENLSESIHLLNALFHLNGNISSIGTNYSFDHFVNGELQSVKISSTELNELTKDAVIQQTYLLGTDKYGRDYLSRLMAGSAISIAVGFIAVFISLLIGIILGLLAGYYRGRTDELIMWFINVIWSIPTLLMVMAITLVFGKGFWKVFLAVGLTMWVEVARIVRGQVIAERELDYVTAARSLGFSDF